MTTNDTRRNSQVTAHIVPPSTHNERHKEGLHEALKGSINAPGSKTAEA